GAFTNCNISVRINKKIDSLQFIEDNLFKIIGTNSGLINGTVEIDTVKNSFVFVPSVPFFAGEIINVCFGPIVTVDGDTLKSFNWQFSVQITNPTTAKFDSLKRFDLCSLYPITIDYNKDGFVDIVSGYCGLVLYNNGKGEFLESQWIPELYGASFLVDLNNDNIIDVVNNNNYTGNVNILLGNETGFFVNHQQLYPVGFQSGSIIALGDINGDGNIDLISREAQNDMGDYSWRILTNDGSGTFIFDSTRMDLKNAITNAKLIDMDKDGDLDLVMLNSICSSPDEFTGAYIYYNDGLGNFSHYTQVKFGYGPSFGGMSFLRQLFVIDYDNNGLNDLATFSSVEGGMVMLQDSIKHFIGYASTYFLAGESSGGFTSGDIDGDNRIDQIISNIQPCGECGDTADINYQAIINTEENFFRGNSSSGGWFLLGKRYQVGSGAFPIMADVDNDGDLDIIHSGSKTAVTYNHTNIVDVKDNIVEPKGFKLSQNYPNPFNGATNISYYLPKSGNVKIIVFNLLGELLEILVDDYYLAGIHDKTFAPKELCSGLYLYKIEYETQTKIKKMIYLK
ncbi:MAG: FG-GAP-like repeat-containing protein, partial [bacterium]